MYAACNQQGCRAANYLANTQERAFARNYPFATLDGKARVNMRENLRRLRCTENVTPRGFNQDRRTAPRHIGVAPVGGMITAVFSRTKEGTKRSRP